MNVIEFHALNHSKRQIYKSDCMVFDLDPDDGVAWKAIAGSGAADPRLPASAGPRKLAQDQRRQGSARRGTAGAALAERLRQGVFSSHRATPGQDYPGTPCRQQRAGQPHRQDFCRLLRNGHGATAAAAFSARARPGMGVSTPVEWARLPELTGGAQRTVVTGRDHLSFCKQDPWAGYIKSRQALARAMKTLGFRPDRAP